MTTDLPNPTPPLPDGPNLPAWRVAQAWMERPVEFWEECGARWGETFTLELGSIGTTVLFSHPDAIRDMFKLPASSYECRPFNLVYKKIMGEHSALMADGDDHRRIRRILGPPVQPRAFGPHIDRVGPIVRETVSVWPTDRPFSPRPELHLLSLKIILTMLVGPSDEDFTRGLIEFFRDEIFRHLLTTTPWTRFVQQQPRLREHISREIARKRSALEPTGPSLFDALIRARDDSGEPLADSEIGDHLCTMLIAGVEPTALALAWGLYWVHENPDVLARLRRELDPIGIAPTATQLLENRYLNAVCAETLRMYPIGPTPTGRKLVAETEIGGRRYPAGVTLVACTHLVHRRPDIYPEPGQFRPERFLDRQFAPHEFFPSGGGLRTCLGASLAPLEMNLALAAILATWSLTPAHDGPVRPVRHATLIAPSEHLKFRATDR